MRARTPPLAARARTQFTPEHLAIEHMALWSVILAQFLRVGGILHIPSHRKLKVLEIRERAFGLRCCFDLISSQIGVLFAHGYVLHKG